MQRHVWWLSTICPRHISLLGLSISLLVDGQHERTDQGDPRLLLWYQALPILFVLNLYLYLIICKDKLKKKYFKVQTSSAAPASSAYSSLDIKRRKLEDERSEALALGIARQKGLIQRSSGLRNSPLSELLAGEKVHSHRDVAQTFVAGLAEQGCFHDPDSMPCSCSPLFDIEPRPDIDSSRVDIRIGKLWSSLVLQHILCVLLSMRTQHG